MSKRNIKIGLALVLALVLSFFIGESRPSSNKADLEREESQIEEGLKKEREEKLLVGKPENKEPEIKEKEEKEEVKDIDLDLSKEDIKKKDEEKEPKVKEEEKKQAENNKKEETPVADSVSIKISARSLLNNKDKLDKNKLGQLPASGVIYYNKSAKLEEGDSVFDLLSRELRANGIHLEASRTPVYNTNYVEGINNIYEFDAGELSGWMYKVNGSFPSYGSSEVKLKAGDVVEWLYTCDLGKDIGGRNELGGGR